MDTKFNCHRIQSNSLSAIFQKAGLQMVVIRVGQPETGKETRISIHTIIHQDSQCLTTEQLYFCELQTLNILPSELYLQQILLVFLD